MLVPSASARVNYIYPRQVRDRALGSADSGTVHGVCMRFEDVIAQRQAQARLQTGGNDDRRAEGRPAEGAVAALKGYVKELLFGAACCGMHHAFLFYMLEMRARMVYQSLDLIKSVFQYGQSNNFIETKIFD